MLFWLGTDNRLDSQSKFQMSTLCWRTKEVFQHGRSVLGSIILSGIFRRISQRWGNAHTLNLENCLYLSSIISQLLDFIHWMVFYLFFIAWQWCPTWAKSTGFLTVFNHVREFANLTIIGDFASALRSWIFIITNCEMRLYKYIFKAKTLHYTLAISFFLNINYCPRQG